MSIRKIWVEIELDGVLTDVAEVTLSDAEATYGVKESVSGTVVVAAGAATVHASTGQYSYDLSGLDPTKAYDACFKVRRANGLIDYSTVHSPAQSLEPSPHLCTVYGTLLDLIGQPVANNNIEVSVDRKRLPRFAQHFLLAGSEVNTETDANGDFQVALIRGALVTLHVKESNMRLQFTVPDVDAINIENIPGAYGAIESVENPF
ncbi:MAG: hypothetical protein ABFE07_29605 [Armatimonadia bacterium]